MNKKDFIDQREMIARDQLEREATDFRNEQPKGGDAALTRSTEPFDPNDVDLRCGPGSECDRSGAEAGRGEREAFVDGFNGDTPKLLRNIAAFLALNEEGAFTGPKLGRGHHAITLLNAAAARLAALQGNGEAVAWRFRWEGRSDWLFTDVKAQVDAMLAGGSYYQVEPLGLLPLYAAPPSNRAQDRAQVEPGDKAVSAYATAKFMRMWKDAHPKRVLSIEAFAKIAARPDGVREALEAARPFVEQAYLSAASSAFKHCAEFRKKILDQIDAALTTLPSRTGLEEAAEWPQARGVSRDADSEQALVVHFDRRLTDDEMRNVHEALRTRAAKTTAPAADREGDRDG